MLLKKLCSFFATLVIVLCATISFSSCDNEDEGGTSGKFVGFWAFTQSVADYVTKPTVKDKYCMMGKAYQFIDDNTVLEYWNIYNSIYVDEYIESKKGLTAMDGHSGWYYSGNPTYLTYFVEGNKAFLSDGKIFTIWDGYLTRDGESIKYEKW